MEYEFVVSEDFGAYKIGNVISDPEEMARIEASDRLKANVTRRFAVKAPEPAPATPRAAKAAEKA